MREAETIITPETPLKTMPSPKGSTGIKTCTGRLGDDAMFLGCK